MKYGKRFGGGGIEKRPGSKPKRALWASSYVARMSGPVRHIDPAEVNARLSQQKRRA